MIEWTKFDWQSFSTLMAGLMALVAALIIGRRQLRLLDAQTSILSKQVDTDRLRLRHELFERRLAVFTATQDLLRHIIAKGDVPDQKTESNFLQAKGQATFLFDEVINQHLQHLWERVTEYQYSRRAQHIAFERDGTFDRGVNQAIADLHREMAKLLASLPEHFEELRLGESIRTYLQSDT